MIARLDDHCLQHDGQRLPDGYQDGPFGVFETRHAHSLTSTVERSAGEDEANSISSQGSATVGPTTFTNLDNQTADLDALISSLEDPPSNESLEEIAIVHQGDNAVETAVLTAQGSSEHDFWDMDNPFSFMDGLNTPLELPTGEFTGMDVFDSTSLIFSTDGFTGLLDNIGGARQSLTPPPGAYAHLLAEAPQLLRYYQHESNFSRPTKQSFWRSFVLPSAMHTFAALTVFGQASDLSSSVFYSILANSAFAMSNSVQPDDPHWHTIGKTAEDAARQYLQKALQSPQPDCKELLTATLSLGLVSVSRSVE